MTTYTIETFDALTLTGYATQLPLPTMTNIQTVSDLKTQHFGALAKSGKFGALMAGSRDHIGFALSGVHQDQLEYFAGANTTVTATDTETRTVPGGHYIVLRAQGGPSRQLFDQLISDFFGQILPTRPELYTGDSYIVEALLNGDPMDAAVELRLPTTVDA
ncbi:GyrI-like domain-containing protein [Lactiplantibacillus daowaiensis]|uniref:GyrI-like domain-containing protein n=1 Tax=Lactiplantibacillus daowaiensis TaxID=2559918 RepID=A0ABW1S4B6_9LACO|nr:GyrI-like domain-containing protein [Lactiplantibacillus daowaiensis]